MRGGLPAAGSRLWFLPLVVASAGVFWFSQQSRPPLPPGEWSDKTLHVVGYFAYGLSAELAFRRGARSPWYGALLWTAFFAVTDELHQSLVPGRSCSILDWVADLVGASLALAFATLTERIGRERIA